MAPLKRGAVAEDAPRKKARRSLDKNSSNGAQATSKPSKPPKPTAASAPKNTTAKATSQASSVLNTEEKSFPRGGASVLTPLEHKQIQAQATRDVLFEQSGTKGPKHDVDADEEDDGEDLGGEEKAASKRRKRKGAKKEDGKAVDAEPTVKVESLSYKRLAIGSMVLGQVVAVTGRDIALALPNNITGYVPVTQVSDQVTERIEKLLAEDDDDDDDDEVDEDGEADDDVDLHNFVKVGQYLRAYVTATEEESHLPSSTQMKRKIELSVNPRQANTGIAESDIVPGMMLSAAVVSVEDHGLIMDIGLGDGKVRGFMPSKETGSGGDHSKISTGAVFLCLVTGTSKDGKVIKLSADAKKTGNLTKHALLRDAPSIDSFLPGTAVEVLVTDNSATSVTARIMGMLDATADLIHSGSGTSKTDATERFPVGSKVKARVICTFPLNDEKKVGVSFLEHVLTLAPSPTSALDGSSDPLNSLPLSSIVEKARVVKVKSGVGLFVDVGVKGVSAFAHISRLSDGKVETIAEDSGPYKVGTIHRARVVGYNALDGLFLVSLEQKILQQRFLTVEDVQIGETVTATVEKLVINAKGLGGVLIKLSDGVTGLVTEMHMADVHLQHPERKFKEGAAVKARVLSTNPQRRQLRLTLKKSLVNSESKVWSDYKTISPGEESPGTLVNVLPAGAIVQFYGIVRAFLPVSEMSDTFIKDPTQHFRLGQVVTVRALEVDPEAQKMTVTCRDPSAFGEAQQKAYSELALGSIVSGKVSEKSPEDVSIELSPSGLKAVLRLTHLTDGSERKNASSMKKINVGQKLNDLVVLNKRDQRHVVELSNKPSLVKAARDGKLLRSFDDVMEAVSVDGFVRNITLQGAFVEFGGGLVGLLLKTQMEEAAQKTPDFGLRIGQSISARVLSVDHGQRRFLLTQRGAKVVSEAKPSANSAFVGGELIEPVDEKCNTILDYTFGKLTKARISSVKETQLNVQLAANLQGRVDVSEAFDSWDAIKDRKRPLRTFKPKQVIDVRVLGMHDTRNHRFLPITHRTVKAPVFELTMKSSEPLESESDVMTLGKVNEGSSWIAFVNNVTDRCVWVNLSPNVRGRIDLMDLTDDVSLLSDVEKNFPIGSAIQVRVKKVDVETNRLDLISAKSSGSNKLTLQDLGEGMILPGRVIKTSERQLIVQLSENVSGVVGLTEFADDFSLANPTTFTKNEVVRVCVVEIDRSNKRVHLSMRPSKVLSSSLPVNDRLISNVSQLKVNDVVRGFVKNVADKGLFVSLGPSFTAHVRIADLSDAYLKDWKSSFEIDQLVTGKVIAVDEGLGQVQLSLKASLLDRDYVPPLKLEDLEVGRIVTGRVRKVEDFGVFILVDNSNNVSGLCHRSEIADGHVEDIKVVYGVGDKVKAKVLKVDLGRRRVNFGLKASYFALGDDEDEESSDDDGGVGVGGADADSDVEMDEGGVALVAANDDAESYGRGGDEDEEMVDAPPKSTLALSTGGFDWTGETARATAATTTTDAQASDDDSDADATVEIRKKKRHKPEIKIDKTGDLDKYGPQSVADYERQLLGQPNSSSLWIQYMAFQLALSEVERARGIAERALKTIHIRDEDEKLNVWVALLNLENTYGSDESVEEAFQRACTYNDPQEMHQRLASIYIDSGKLEKAEALFQAMTKSKSMTANPSFWLNYATFLMTTASSAAKARALLPRALQSVPSFHHRDLTAKFGALEFKSPNGDTERGRTIFEGLLDSFPRRADLWDMFIDVERSHGGGNVDNVRGLFERVAALKMKKRRAAFVFKRWREFEEAQGNEKGVERVGARALEVELERERSGDDG